MPQALLAEWKEALKRLDYLGNPRIDVHQFPRPPHVLSFLGGEGEYDVQKGKFNEANNPMRLVRPYALHSCDSLYYEIKPGWGSPSIYRQERGWSGECEKEQAYLKLVQAFETFSVALLESLDQADPSQRRAQVKDALDAAFGGKRVSQYLQPEDVRKASPEQSPESWLVYGVINILNHPSPELGALARLRALELLSLFTPEKLEQGFRSPKQQYHNGYDRVSPPHIPDCVATREERLADKQENWERNPFLQDLLVRDNNRRLDVQAVVTRLLEERPDLAVGVAMLLLHKADTTRAALALLQSIPKLDAETQEKVMGPGASYLVDRFGPPGAAGQVVQGLGLAPRPTRGPSLSAEEMQQLVARKDAYAAHLKEELSRVQARLESLQLELGESQTRAQALQVHVTHLQDGRERERQEQAALVQTLVELSGKPPLERARGLVESLRGRFPGEPEFDILRKAREDALRDAAALARSLPDLGLVAAASAGAGKETAGWLLVCAQNLVGGSLGTTLAGLAAQVESGQLAPDAALADLTRMGEDMSRLEAARQPGQGVVVGDNHVQVGGVRLTRRQVKAD